VRTVLIGGIGNVLLGDDAIGPFVVHRLESEYVFGDDVEIVDLGTPSLDLTQRITGLRAVLLVDCVASRDYAPGTVLLFHKQDIPRTLPTERLDPHSPALSECLMAAEMLGASPQHVLLIGIVGCSFEPGSRLSGPVRMATRKAIDAALGFLDQLGIAYEKRPSPVSLPCFAEQLFLAGENSQSRCG